MDGMFGKQEWEGMALFHTAGVQVVGEVGIARDKSFEEGMCVGE